MMPHLKASEFDYIIFDMPPLNQTSVTLAMSAWMDKVLVVVEAERSNRDFVKRTYAELLACRANTSVIYVPPMFAADAIMEAADAGVRFIVAITEGVPVIDMTRAWPFVKERGARLLGPNCPGLISAGQSKVGISRYQGGSSP